MKNKIDFNVEIVDNDLLFSQKITKLMNVNTAFQELQKLRQELSQLETQKLQIETMINSGKLENDLDNIKNQYNGLKEVEQKWETLIAPMIEKVRTELQNKVKKAKIKQGYLRIKDGTMKIIKQNEILTPIAEELGIDIAHPLIREIKNKFEEV